jgi:hypothetical protein
MKPRLYTETLTREDNVFSAGQASELSSLRYDVKSSR